MSASKAEHANHVLPLRLYLAVGAVLIVLTFVTVAISFIHFGGWNLVVALLIASVKATLVALFFMHLKYDSKLYLIVFLGAILFLAIFIVFTMFDTMERDQIYQIEAKPIRENAAMYDDSSRGMHSVPHDSIQPDSSQ